MSGVKRHVLSNRGLGGSSLVSRAQGLGPEGLAGFGVRFGIWVPGRGFRDSGGIADYFELRGQPQILQEHTLTSEVFLSPAIHLYTYIYIYIHTRNPEPERETLNPTVRSPGCQQFRHVHDDMALH